MSIDKKIMQVELNRFLDKKCSLLVEDEEFWKNFLRYGYKHDVGNAINRMKYLHESLSSKNIPSQCIADRIDVGCRFYARRFEPLWPPDLVPF